MQFSIVIASLIATVAAQGLPQCGISTMAKALQASGCKSSDDACMCNSTDVRGALEGLGSVCPDADDKKAYEDYYTKQCSSQSGYTPLTIN